MAATGWKERRSGSILIGMLSLQLGQVLWFPELACFVIFRTHGAAAGHSSPARTVLGGRHGTSRPPPLLPGQRLLAAVRSANWRHNRAVVGAALPPGLPLLLTSYPAGARHQILIFAMLAVIGRCAAPATLVATPPLLFPERHLPARRPMWSLYAANEYGAVRLLHGD